jgi:Bacterial PH domain
VEARDGRDASVHPRHCPFFSIRGYVLDAVSIHVLRPGWKTTVMLAGLQSATHDADAMSRSIRTFGNGGLFCIAGAFRNTTLGAYCAFATDPARAVVLKFQDRTVVLTPDRPDEFVAKIRAMRRLAG